MSPIIVPLSAPCPSLYSDKTSKIVHIDSRDDIKKVKKVLDNKCKIVSWINNPNTLLRGTTLAIKKEVAMSLANQIYATGLECAIPINVTNQNLKLLTQLAHGSIPSKIWRFNINKKITAYLIAIGGGEIWRFLLIF